MTWEERWHPLREEWIIVAAHRQNRPWNGEMVEREDAVLPDYAPEEKAAELRAQSNIHYKQTRQQRASATHQETNR